MRFGPLTIEYDDRVIEPRPWTVCQSQWAAELLTGAPPGPVLELCAGVGHIGLLAVDGTDRTLVLVDLNEAACALAGRNAARAGATVEVRHGELEEALRPDERFALVIADPPWVPSDDVHQHPDDPLLAIDGGSDGLDVARSCVDVISRHLLAGGAAVVQVGDEDQVRALAAYVEERPALGLRLVDSRVLDNGALAHLERRPDALERA